MKSMATDTKQEHKTKRQQQAEQTRKNIFNAAVSVINEKGYNNVQIEDITDAAHVAKGSFYTYFQSKEDIIRYLFEESDSIYADAYARVEGETFDEALSQFVSMSYKANEKRGKGIIKAMVANYFNIDDLEIYGPERVLVRCLNDLVQLGKNEGTLDNKISNDRYVSYLMNTIVGVEVMWCFDETGRSLSDMMEETVSLMIKGMERAR